MAGPARERGDDPRTDVDSILQSWATRMNASREEVERAIWAVGYNVDAVREYIEDRRSERGHTPEEGPRS
jgi:hypothetical protein